MTWDPLQGVGPHGVLTTGVGRHPAAPPFDAVLAPHVAHARGWTDVDASRRPTTDPDDVVVTFGAVRDWLAHEYARATDGRGVDPH